MFKEDIVRSNNQLTTVKTRTVAYVGYLELVTSLSRLVTLTLAGTDSVKMKIRAESRYDEQCKRHMENRPSK